MTRKVHVGSIWYPDVVSGYGEVNVSKGGVHLNEPNYVSFLAFDLKTKTTTPKSAFDRIFRQVKASVH